MHTMSESDSQDAVYDRLESMDDGEYEQLCRDLNLGGPVEAPAVAEALVDAAGSWEGAASYLYWKVEA